MSQIRWFGFFIVLVISSAGSALPKEDAPLCVGEVVYYPIPINGKDGSDGFDFRFGTVVGHGSKVDVQLNWDNSIHQAEPSDLFAL